MYFDDYIYIGGDGFIRLDEYLRSLSTLELNNLINSDGLVHIKNSRFKRDYMLPKLLDVRIENRIKKLNKI